MSHFQGISGNVIESAKEIESSTLSSGRDVVSSTVRQRHLNSAKQKENSYSNGEVSREKQLKNESWKRILLLIIAITVHNIPGT